MPGSTPTYDAVIAGGGIGGLCAAIALRRAGFDAHVFEQAPRLTEVGAGLSLFANAIRALAALGLDDAVRRIGCLATGALRTPDGAPLSKPIPQDLLRRYPDFCLVVHRAELQALRRYESLRRERTAAIVSQSRQAGRLGQVERPLAVHLRNTALRMLPAGLQVRQLKRLLAYDAGSV